MPTDSRLILAIDLYDHDKAVEMARIAEGRVRAIKVNWPLVMSAGISIVKELSKYADILCDFKVADIPQTAMLITRKARENDAWGIISHIFTGTDSLLAVKESAGPMKVFGVVYMSHPGTTEFMQQNTEKFLSIARENGLYGVIVAGNNYEAIRNLRGKAGSLKIAAPGVGVQGGSAAEAAKSGADYLIIGRQIVQAEDPVSVIDQINDDIKKAPPLKY